MNRFPGRTPLSYDESTKAIQDAFAKNREDTDAIELEQELDQEANNAAQDANIVDESGEVGEVGDFAFEDVALDGAAEAGGEALAMGAAEALGPVGLALVAGLGIYDIVHRSEKYHKALAYARKYNHRHVSTDADMLSFYDQVQKDELRQAQANKLDLGQNATWDEIKAEAELHPDKLVDDRHLLFGGPDGPMWTGSGRPNLSPADEDAYIAEHAPPPPPVTKISTTVNTVLPPKPTGRPTGRIATTIPVVTDPVVTPVKADPVVTDPIVTPVKADPVVTDPVVTPIGPPAATPVITPVGTPAAAPAAAPIGPPLAPSTTTSAYPPSINDNVADDDESAPDAAGGSTDGRPESSILDLLVSHMGKRDRRMLNSGHWYYPDAKESTNQAGLIALSIIRSKRQKL